MKISLIAILVACIFNDVSTTGPCNSEELNSKCIPRLSSGFNYIKTYKIDGVDGKKDKIEYSYVFTKDTQYFINICTSGMDTDGIIVSLFDSSRNRVATSKVDNKFISGIAYQCNSSGIYYIQYTFDGSISYCGGSVLAFKRK